jgi:hypothetical protein
LCGTGKALAGNNEMLPGLGFYLIFICAGAQASTEDNEYIYVSAVRRNYLHIRPVGCMGFHPAGQRGQVYFGVAGPAELKRYPDIKYASL